MSDHRCRYCHQPFQPALFRPQQVVCGHPACQRQRRRDYHRRKIETDPVYRQVCWDSQRKWRDLHPDYPRQYRQTHPESVRRNRQGQRGRDRQHRLQHLVKNNLALDLKRSAAEVWLLGPEIEPLVKNTLAFSQVLIYQTVPFGPAPPEVS